MKNPTTHTQRQVTQVWLCPHLQVLKHRFNYCTKEKYIIHYLVTTAWARWGSGGCRFHVSDLMTTSPCFGWRRWTLVSVSQSLNRNSFNQKGSCHATMTLHHWWSDSELLSVLWIVNSDFCFIHSFIYVLYAFRIIGGCCSPPKGPNPESPVCCEVTVLTRLHHISSPIHLQYNSTYNAIQSPAADCFEFMYQNTSPLMTQNCPCTLLCWSTASSKPSSQRFKLGREPSLSHGYQQVVLAACKLTRLCLREGWTEAERTQRECVCGVSFWRPANHDEKPLHN